MVAPQMCFYFKIHQKVCPWRDFVDFRMYAIVSYNFGRCIISINLFLRIFQKMYPTLLSCFSLQSLSQSWKFDQIFSQSRRLLTLECCRSGIPNGIDFGSWHVVQMNLSYSASPWTIPRLQNWLNASKILKKFSLKFWFLFFGGGGERNKGKCYCGNIEKYCLFWKEFNFVA